MTTRRSALAWAAAALATPRLAGAAADAQPAPASPGPAPAPAPAPASGTAAVPWQAGLDAWLEAQRRAWGVPGLAVALLQGGQPVYLKTFGTRDAAQRLPVTPQTLFRGGSTTKALGAASIALLVDEGRLAWDAPVGTWLPELRLAGGEAYAGLSLRDMLAHRSGLPRHDLLWYNNQQLTREALVARMQHLPMTAPLRTRYQYTNLMVVLAGHALERVTGQSWEAFTRERLFEPLGLRRSGFSAVDMARDADHATGFTSLADAAAPGGRRLAAVPLRDDPLLGPAGAWNGSIGEFAAWAQFQLAQGQWRGRRLLSGAAFATMWEPVLLAGEAPRPLEQDRSVVALGWRIDRFRDTLRVAHGGDLNGFTCRVVLLPQKNAAVALLVNHGSHPLPNALTPDLLDHLLGLPHTDNAGRVLARRQATLAQQPARAETPASPVPAALQAACVGLYRHPGYGDLQVSAEGPGLQARYNDMPAQLQPWPAREGEGFVTRGTRLQHGDFGGLRWQVQRGADGRVAALAGELQEGVPPLVFERVG